MIAYQTDDNGIYIGTTEADESPLEPGVFHYPRGAVAVAPPNIPEGQRARWANVRWVLEDIPEEPVEVTPDPDPLTPEEQRALMPPLTRRQFFIACAALGVLTEQEAEDAAAGSTIPASVAAVLDQIQDPAERLGARITFRSFTEANRLDPMVDLFAGLQTPPLTDEQLDAIWQGYVAL